MWWIWCHLYKRVCRNGKPHFTLFPCRALHPKANSSISRLIRTLWDAAGLHSARTAILCQACAGSKQEHHFVPSSLDQFNGPCMGNTTCWLPIDLHDLISNLLYVHIRNETKQKQQQKSNYWNKSIHFNPGVPHSESKTNYADDMRTDKYAFSKYGAHPPTHCNSPEEQSIIEDDRTSQGKVCKHVTLFE